jgi:nicotinamide mononucleotide transporter
MELLQVVELLSAASCLISIWLNTKRKTAGWPLGLISVVLAAWVYYKSGLFAECSLQGFYLLSGVYGWWRWTGLAGTEPEGKIQAVRVSVTEGFLGLILAFLGSMLIWQILLRVPRAGSPLPDALLTGFSLLAQIWLARGKLENWLLWIFINLGSVLLYLQRELWFFTALYLILLGLAVKGYVLWKKSLKVC